MKAMRYEISGDISKFRSAGGHRVCWVVSEHSADDFGVRSAPVVMTVELNKKQNEEIRKHAYQIGLPFSSTFPSFVVLPPTSSRVMLEGGS